MDNIVVKLTKENKEIIDDWRKDRGLLGGLNRNSTYYIGGEESDGKRGYCYSYMPDGYREVSWEYFKLYEIDGIVIEPLPLIFN